MPVCGWISGRIGRSADNSAYSIDTPEVFAVILLLRVSTTWPGQLAIWALK